MLHDLVRENIVKERLKELKMLGVSGSETSETLKALTLSVQLRGDFIVDVNSYIILHAWKEHFYIPRVEGGRTDVVRQCELRYVDERVHYIEDGQDKGTNWSKKPTEYWRVGNRFGKIRNGQFKVTQQKVNFDFNNDTVIEEVRQYSDMTEEIWELKWKTWRKLK